MFESVTAGTSGTVVATLSAVTDADRSGATPTYTMVSGDGGKFALDTNQIKLINDIEPDNPSPEAYM